MNTLFANRKHVLAAAAAVDVVCWGLLITYLIW